MGAGISRIAAMNFSRNRREMIKQNTSVLVPQEMTKLDCEHLRRSWLIIVPDDVRQFELLYEFGMDVYDQIFRMEPSVMKFFPAIQAAAEKSSSQLEMRQIPAFRNQALRLVDVLSYSVQGCDCVSSLEPKLRELGYRHRMYVRGAELTRDHFRVVEKATLVVLQSRLEQHRANGNQSRLDDDIIQKMLQAWAALLDYIAFQIMAGYVSDK